jgi:exodeoxyribonuclease VII large subunit
MHSSASASRNILTVTKLNRLSRSILESEIGQVWLTAEISNFVSASSGHWYFTLKDDRAQVRGAMFRGANRRVIQKPKEGDKVLVKANIGIYEARGDYQLVVEHMEADGEGLLKQKFEQLKIKLAGEGLFSQQNKQTLPDAITRVGVITSSTGAALHDIVTVLKRRNPATSVIIYPSQVQGDAAAQQLCDAISIANSRNEVDVLIFGRGGGSLEDLWCFNEEKVARAVFSSVIPIVSAVGHEVDVTISDFVADLRAPTPSAAAELVSQDSSEFINKIQLLVARLVRTSQNLMTNLTYRRQVLDQRLNQNHPKTILQQKGQLLDQLTLALNNRMKLMVSQQQERASRLVGKVQLLSPQRQIDKQQQRLQQLQMRLQQTALNKLENSKHKLANATHLLDTVSPLATMSRGYSITFKQDELVKEAKQLAPGDMISTKFIDGKVLSKVIEN